MYLLDLIFRLPPNVFVHVKIRGNKHDFSFTTGKRNNAKNGKLILDECGHDVKVDNIYPLWHAEELYVECS